MAFGAVVLVCDWWHRYKAHFLSPLISKGIFGKETHSVLWTFVWMPYSWNATLYMRMVACVQTLLQFLNLHVCTVTRGTHEEICYRRSECWCMFNDSIEKQQQQSNDIWLSQNPNSTFPTRFSWKQQSAVYKSVFTYIHKTLVMSFNCVPPKKLDYRFDPFIWICSMLPLLVVYIHKNWIQLSYMYAYSCRWNTVQLNYMQHDRMVQLNQFIIQTSSMKSLIWA